LEMGLATHLYRYLITSKQRSFQFPITYQWSTILLAKLPAPHVLQKPFPIFSKPKIPLPSRYVLAICPNSNLDKPVNAPHPYFFKTLINIILPSTSKYQVGTFSQVSPRKFCMHFSSPP
jgi:hypothetical protein